MPEAAIAEIGHNKPPPSPCEALGAHISDLLTEARHWADGTDIATEEQHEEVSRLIDELREAEKAADDQRKKELEPYEEKTKEIQAFFNVWIAPLKNKVPGSIPKAVAALKATAEKWRLKKAAEAAAAAEAARKEAEAKATAAAEAARAADPSNLDALEAAEALVADAQAAAKDAARADKAATSGLGLTTYYEAVLTDKRAAVVHYMGEQPQAFIDLVQQLAAVDVRAGKRQIPGFIVEERKRAR